MNSLKTILFATTCVIAAAAFSSTAKAEAAMDGGSMWAGPYIGVQLGAGSGTTEHTDKDFWYNNSQEFGTTDGAFIGGGKIGWDWVEGSTIFGIFAEYSFSNIDTEEEVTGSLAGPDYQAGSEIDGIGSIRAKLGMASGDVAGSVSVGLAYQNADDEFEETDGSPIDGIDDDSEDFGWAFGLGTEYAIGNNGFIGLDASHYIFGEETHEVMDGGPTGFFFDFQNTVSTAMISYTYKFN